MMPIKPVEASLTEDQKAKIQGAVKQMADLMQELNQWVKYRLLSTLDRQQLIQKGFARDLVDNLVYFTQRYGAHDVTVEDDHLVVGFTEAAFDPSLYACDAIVQSLRTANAGRCSWCESLIEQNNGIISHYRPPAGYSEHNVLHRDAYYSQAYQQNNLFYSCSECADSYKSDHFPVLGNERMPKVPLQQENPVRLNPYIDDPRQYIRFNPMNACAYPYDRVLGFYQESQDKGSSEVSALLWENPANIPLQQDINGNSISSSMVDSGFYQWLHSQTGYKAENLSRGQSTIDILGLNRSALIRARAYHLRQLRGLYLAQFNQLTAYSVETAQISPLIQDLGFISSDNGLQTPQYLSLTLDAINTWLAEDKVEPVRSGVAL